MTESRGWPAITGSSINAPFGSLDQFDPVTEVFKPYLTQDSPLGRPIIEVQQDRNGELWLATNQGLFRMDPATRRNVRYGHDSNAEGSLSADEVRATLEGMARFGGDNEDDRPVGSPDRKGRAAISSQSRPFANEAGTEAVLTVLAAVAYSTFNRGPFSLLRIKKAGA